MYLLYFKKYIALFLFLIFLFNISCKTNSTNKNIDSASWYFLDFPKDSIVGISLNKLYDNVNFKSKENSKIIAILDAQVDLNHEDLKNIFWVNHDEIRNNGIDDDQNGYVDDINGWNFIGKSDGTTSTFANFESTRIIRKYRDKFSGSTKDTLDPNYRLYKNALLLYDGDEEYYKYYHDLELFNLKSLIKAKDTISKFFNQQDFSISEVDSLFELLDDHKSKSVYDRQEDQDSAFTDLLLYYSFLEKNNKNTKNLTESVAHYDSILQKMLGFNYNERVLIEKTPRKTKNIYFGNPILNDNNKLQRHGTKVAGIIGADRTNEIGIQGITNNVKIMPLVTSPFGDEYDKDIAQAIKYAVDNGAKIINITFTKYISLDEIEVQNAIKYAEEKDVLIIKSAGNDSFDIDLYESFPSDVDYEKKEEYAKNMIVVGASTIHADSKLIANFSNYGKNNVDLFAPGVDIYTTSPNSKYESNNQGTSYSSPIVSGVAALIWSEFPNLSAVEMKQILLDSTTKFPELKVEKPGTSDLVPFSSLSKSGGILNAYNAYFLAKEVSQKKKR